ncbi:hypothetical protein ACT8ZV_22160 [Nocardioides sp. MAHUQ-72]|uniref:hypothetical protein n=1 Tax=unclassified Nocardioides TaxID=2615069 RepID=UPI00360DB203
MRLDWIPASAAAFVTGAMALTFGSLLLPTGSDSADTLRIVQQQDGRWLAAAVVFFIAAVALTLGLPAALSLFDRRGRGLAMVSTVVLAIGFLGTAGYAMLMVFFRAMVLNIPIDDQALDNVSHEAGLAVFLYGWIAGFYVGELLFAIALLRAGTVAHWVPAVLLAHVASLTVSNLLPQALSQSLVLLVAVGFAGVAIEAVTRDSERRRATPVRL